MCTNSRGTKREFAMDCENEQLRLVAYGKAVAIVMNLRGANDHINCG